MSKKHKRKRPKWLEKITNFQASRNLNKRKKQMFPYTPNHALRVVQPPEYEDKPKGRTAHLESGKARTPQELYEIYDMRVHEEGGVNLSPFTTLKEFEQGRDESEINFMASNALLQDSFEHDNVAGEISLELTRLSRYHKTNQHLVYDWFKVRSKLKNPKEYDSKLRGIESAIDSSLKEAFHIIRRLAPLPLRGFTLKLVSRSGCIDPYKGMVPLKMVRCDICYYPNSAPELYGLSDFNDSGSDYSISPYLSFFRKPPLVKYPDDHAWDEDNPNWATGVHPVTPHYPEEWNYGYFG